MMIRVLPDELINQIAAGEVVERPASVIKELVENALDAGADQVVIDVTDGGRTLINIVDNGMGMTRENLEKSVLRHATSKLPSDDLLNIKTMGFRGEALPSIASVSDMTIDTRYRDGGNGMQLNASTNEIKPSAWDSGTRIRVENLFARTPARLKFLRSDKSEMMAIVEIVKRLAMGRSDVGFTLNQKWRYPKNQPLIERVVSVMGDDVSGRMLELSAAEGDLKLSGYISEPTLHRASSVDQYLFVNGRPVKDKVLVAALRAGYMDVMSAREFPLCALYLELPPMDVDVNVSPAKTEVHFLEPARVRSFIIRAIRNTLSQTLVSRVPDMPNMPTSGHLMDAAFAQSFARPVEQSMQFISEPRANTSMMRHSFGPVSAPSPIPHVPEKHPDTELAGVQNDKPLGRVIGQVGNKYIIAENETGLVIVDQHAAHERLTYEKLRNHEIKRQPLLVPLVIELKPEEVTAISEVADELALSGLTVEPFGETAVSIQEKPADWDMDWAAALRALAQEVLVNGHSSRVHEKLHLKLANYACHHSVRSGQRLDFMQMDALLRDIENTERAGQCNHGRPVYKFISIHELDGIFERC